MTRKSLQIHTEVAVHN